MSDCSNHKKDLFGQTDMKLVAEAISDLHYETLVDLFGFIEGKLFIDAMNDNRNGRQQLAKALYRTVQGINAARKGIEDAWQISKPFMETKCPRCKGEGEIEKNIPGNEGVPERDVMVGCPECGGTGIENP